MRAAVSMGCVGLLVAVMGCEWEGMSDEHWNSAASWVIFGGLYRAANNGLLVQNASVSMANTSTIVPDVTLGYGNGVKTTFDGLFGNAPVVPGSVLISAGSIDFVDDGNGLLTTIDGFGGVVTEAVATGDGAQTTFAGTFSSFPVVPGSVSITAAGVTLVDDGNGTLSGGGKTGTIIYSTGAWSINLLGLPPVLGESVMATYQYSTSSMSGTIVYDTGAWTINLQGFALSTGTRIAATYRYAPDPSDAAAAGSNGTPIYTFAVNQTGNRLVITDSNGNRFEGQIYDIISTTGEQTGYPEVIGDQGVMALIVANFYAEGMAFGRNVTIQGTFQGTIIDEYEFMLFDRIMNGTWSESGGMQGVFMGLAPYYIGTSLDPILTDLSFTP